MISSSFLSKIRRDETQPAGVPIEKSVSSFSTRSRGVPSESIIISIPSLQDIERVDKGEYKPVVLMRPLTRLQHLTLDFLTGMCREDYPSVPEEPEEPEQESQPMESDASEALDIVDMAFVQSPLRESLVSIRQRGSTVCLALQL
jgi:hypothetical protein